MAIEAISSNVVTQQMPKVEKTAPVEKIEVTEQQPSQIQEFSPIVETQGSGNQNAGKDKDHDGKDDAKNLQEVSPEKVKSAIADINKRIAPTETQLQFSYHEKTHRISITVRDKETDKVIREIPPEKTLDMIAKSLELAGILVDEKR
ncbi:MAG: flagellar protein FlaG [Eubacteriales bacterium]|nr:flagellar protein FlaG [Eubacteriales bacterium]